MERGVIFVPTGWVSEKTKVSPQARSPRFRLSVCAASDLPRYVNEEVTHILSIDRPGFPTPTPNWFSGVHKHVFFQDVFSRRDAAMFNAKAPTAADVREILEFGRNCMVHSKTADTQVLIHCTHGASRSPAAAYAILCLWLGKDRENEAMDLLLRIKPDAVPNSLVIAYADRLLRREGKMIEAIHLLYDNIDKRVRL